MKEMITDYQHDNTNKGLHAGDSDNDNCSSGAFITSEVTCETAANVWVNRLNCHFILHLAKQQI